MGTHNVSSEIFEIITVEEFELLLQGENVID